MAILILHKPAPQISYPITQSTFSKEVPLIMRLLILSDIHANLSALNAVLQQASSHPSAISAALLLGDLIDYGMHSNEVIESIQKDFPYPILCTLRGNHELVMLTQDYRRLSSDRCRQCSQYTRTILSENTWRYITDTMYPAALQELQIDGKKCLAIHGSLEDPYWRSISPGERSTAYASYDYVFSGHSHFPHFFEVYYEADCPQTRNKKKTIFINPGSVGQPRNLTPMAHFAILDTDTGTVSMERAAYDIAREQQAYTGQVHDFYRKRLEYGI